MTSGILFLEKAKFLIGGEVKPLPCIRPQVKAFPESDVESCDSDEQDRGVLLIDGVDHGSGLRRLREEVPAIRWR